MLVNLLKSVVLMCAVSMLGAGACYAFGVSPIAGFVGVFTLQIILFNCVRYIRESYMAVRIQELQTQEIESMEKQGMELACAHCKAESFVPIRFDEQNEFKCENCGENNTIYVNVTVARETTSLNMDSITRRLLIDDEERAKDAILITGSKDE